MKFQEILLEYLQLHNMTQTQFAFLINVKQSQVSEWLKGKANPSYQIMKCILEKTEESAAFWFDLQA